VPLYEISAGGGLVPFRRIPGGPDLYESEIERLVWENPEEFLGESLLLVAQQPTLPQGGRPDIVGLDMDGRVVVIEVKRDVDRSQLAQSLEYAGWARSTNLDEIAGMYQRGAETFFTDWQEFTGRDVLQVINRRPRLILVARNLHGRTAAALNFLIDAGLPVKVVEVSIYQDQQARRFLDIEGEHEPEFEIGSERRRQEFLVEGRRITLADLIEAGLLEGGDDLVWERPQLGQEYSAQLLENGAIELPNGETHASPSGAAKAAAGIAAIDGWQCWKVTRLQGVRIDSLRAQLLAGGA